MQQQFIASVKTNDKNKSLQKYQSTKQDIYNYE